MQQELLLWKKIHEHRGSVTTLAWSPTGQHLCCASFTGEVSVIDAQAWEETKLIEPPTQDGGLSRGPYAVWDTTRDAIAVDTLTGLKVLDLAGHQLADAGDMYRWLMCARPIQGGYAWAELADDRTPRIVAISDADGGDVWRLPEAFPCITDLSWSPDGCSLAIACGWGVSVARPRRVEVAGISVSGGAHKVIWLDDSRLAVGCLDTNIRVYAWLGALVARRTAAVLVEVLETHDAAIIELSGPNVSGQFASRDNSGSLCFWARATHGHVLVQSAQLGHGGSTMNITVAMHPNKPLVAVDMNGIVSVAEHLPPPQSATEAAAAQPTSPLGTVLLRAGISGALVHSDAVARAWEIGPEHWSSPFEEKVSATRVCKAIAVATRGLLHDVGECLRVVWSRPTVEAAVELERLAFAPAFATGAAFEVRRRLLELLDAEIAADRPRLRAWATAAYVGLGHLGLKEAGVAFASPRDRLLLRMNEPLRRAFLAAEPLLHERKVDGVGKAVEGAAEAITQVLAQERAIGGSRLCTDTRHALILKGGGAKGLAHVGALSEIRQYFPFDRFVGTSAGAIVAVLLGAGFSDQELEDELVATSFNELIREPWPRRIWNLMAHGGLYTAHGIGNWLDRLLAKKLASASQIQLSDLPLHTTVYACQGHKPVITFDSKDPESWTDFASYAARCSMSIPFYFTKSLKGGVPIFDPGFRVNYPVEPLLAKTPGTPFIGLYLGIPIYEPNAGKGMFSALLEAVLEANDNENLKKYSERTVIIDTRPIGTLDFKLSDKEKRFLVLAGRVAALRFLKARGVDLSDRTDVEQLNVEHDDLRVQLLAGRAQRARRRRRVMWSAVLLILAFGAWRWLPLSVAWP